MPLDPMNMPFPRHTADDGGSATSSGGTIDRTLKIETMLMEEFNYASVTAYQSLEDRARMFNLYLLLIGVVASGVGAIFQLGGAVRYTALLVLLLLVGALLGMVFFTKLIRLRQAWRESAIAMNCIKEFYIQRFRNEIPNIEAAFRWRLSTIPAGERWGSVTFLVCATVALLGAICLGGAVFEAYPKVGHVLSNQVPLAPALQQILAATVVSLIYLVFLVQLYRSTFNASKEREAIKKAAERLGVNP